MTDIGFRIKERREALQMTQEELAAKVGYKSRSAVNKVELGKRDVSQSMIVRYANALGTTPSELMGWATRSNDSTHGEGTQALLDICEKLSPQSLMHLIRYANLLLEEQCGNAKEVVR